MIYLIHCEKTNTCKIGFTDNINGRFTALQTGNPYQLKLIAVIEGNYEREKHIHGIFDANRLHGEWFDYTSEIKMAFDNPSLIESNKKIKRNNSKIITILQQCRHSRILLFLALYQRYCNGSVFTFNRSLRLIIARENECNERTLEVAFKDILKVGLVVCVDKRLFTINAIYNPSDSSKQKELIKSMLQMKYPRT
jgi:hypothetical protein